MSWPSIRRRCAHATIRQGPHLMDDSVTSYPFPDDAIRAHVHDRDRPVCGGFTMLTVNQADDPGPTFTCSHGPTAGCGWRVQTAHPFAPHAILVFEIDYADELHRQHAWRRLEERSGPPST